MSYAAAQAASAAAAYRSSQQLDQRPAAVLAAAHQELARLLASAIAAYQARRLDEMCRHNARAVRLLLGLITALQGRSPEADALARDYARLRDALNGLLLRPDDMKTLQSGLEWCRNLTKSFLSELETTQVPANVARIA